MSETFQAVTGATAKPPFSGVRVTPTGGPLAADISGVDLSVPLDKNTLRAIEQAWTDHLVLRFRGQKLNDDQLMAFSRNFGVLDAAPIGTPNMHQDANPGYVILISNIVVDGKAIGGLGSYESSWHSDMTYNENPPIASFLYAVEVPSSGGDTGFANMYLAYDQLSDAMKQRIASLRCKHDSSRNSAGELRRGFKEVDDPRDAPGAIHPLVIEHPVSGRKALNLGRRRNSNIIGLPLQESEQLLDELWAHATQPAYSWYQQWRVDDLVMWDNRATLHRRDAFNPDERRLMRRTQISAA